MSVVELSEQLSLCLFWLPQFYGKIHSFLRLHVKSDFFIFKILYFESFSY